MSKIGERVTILPWWKAFDAKVNLLDDCAIWSHYATMMHRRILQHPTHFRLLSAVERRPAFCSVSKALHIPVLVPHPSNARTSFPDSKSFNDGRPRFLLPPDDDDAIAEKDAEM